MRSRSLAPGGSESDPRPVISSITMHWGAHVAGGAHRGSCALARRRVSTAAQQTNRRYEFGLHFAHGTDSAPHRNCRQVTRGDQQGQGPRSSDGYQLARDRLWKSDVEPCRDCFAATRAILLFGDAPPRSRMQLILRRQRDTRLGCFKLDKHPTYAKRVGIACQKIRHKFPG
jgi:hypothetical protein